MTLSETQNAILIQADQHPDGVATPPHHLPPGPKQSIAKALLKAGFVEPIEVSASDPEAAWKFDGEPTGLRITEAGRQAVASAGDTPGIATAVAHVAAERDVAAAVAPSSSDAPCARGTGPRGPKLRQAAIAFLACWDATTEREALADAVSTLRIILEPRSSGTPRAPRQGTKQEAVLNLLRRQEGTTVSAVMTETGWAQHTVRGFFAGLKTKGHVVEVLERVRQIGPGNAGAKGSYSIYRIAGAA